MLRYEPHFRRLAFALAALAGFVDAMGFLTSGGLFVSFMSGNSTRLAIGAAQSATAALAAAALIVLFVTGVILNLLVVDRFAFAHRKVIAMMGVCILLIAAAIFQSLDVPLLTIGLLCMAMGALNTIFRREGEVSIGLTYMTGTLVKLGYRLAEAVRGGDRTGWQPYLLLWLSLICGGIAGAITYGWSPTACFWTAAGIALLSLLFMHRMIPNR
ncbi:protein of unknown function DUF1275 [Sphingobium chlorophenolicum L-1]|uniref:DUF1275 domain-containing protein n=1 Tax=Sphingobium chlorophenolicum L-1 TaxID=690566 RepID=F6EYT5_SPHCR|nr:protein of unknown function DUF1275 [Sphingobium chlorophenolicum L-1]